MTFCVECETDKSCGLDYQEIFEKVAVKTLDILECPYEAQVNLLVTDDENIREMNSEFRNLDRSTDVLSFPMIEYDVPGDFSCVDEDVCDYFDPESGELILGDIVVSVDHVLSQADSYGHSVYREFAFLIAHSMLHLSGYDHMTESDASSMFALQEEILSQLGISR